MSDDKQSGKIKNDKIQRWRIELSNYKYDIIRWYIVLERAVLLRMLCLGLVVLPSPSQTFQPISEFVSPRGDSTDPLDLI
jgi:hypothetical protein